MTNQARKNADTMTEVQATSRANHEGPVRAFASSRWAPLPILMAGTFMIVMDFFIVNVAFPSMQTSLHASASAIEWVVAGYGLTFASMLIISGRLGDHLGRRRLFTMGLSLFVVSSIACACAPDSTVLIVARLVQGGAAAMISPNVLSILGVVFTGADRVRAISVYGITLGMAAASGQLVGGLIIAWNVADSGWRGIFLINVPIGLAALLLARRFIPESRADRASPLDLVGMALLTVGLTAVVLPLIEGPQLSWPWWTWSSLILAVPFLAVFYIYETALVQRGGAALVDPALFGQRSFSAGLATQLGLWCSMASFFLVLSLYLQHGRGLDPLQSGLVFTILAGAFLIASLRAPALTMRFGRSLVAVGGLTLASGFAVLFAVVHDIGTGGSIWALAPGLALIGAGQGLTITPLTTTVLSHAEPQRAGAVSGILATTQQIGNSLGVAITGAIFFSTAHAGYGKAFECSLVELVALLGVMVVVSRLLPPPRSGRLETLRPAMAANGKDQR
jgi:EmrB/QacA subfamily drug resistance transporter